MPITLRFSGELSALHAKFQRLLKQREDLESDLQRHCSTIIFYLEGISSVLTLFSIDAPSLTLRSSPLHGLHVHIARSKRDAAKAKASPAFTLIAESNSTCCLFHQVRRWPHTQRIQASSEHRDVRVGQRLEANSWRHLRASPQLRRLHSRR